MDSHLEKQIAEEFKCSICLYVYEKPRTLPCSHTFCGECIKKYLGSKCENTLSYECPNCKKKIPTKENDPEKIYENLMVPTNIQNVVNLITKEKDSKMQDTRKDSGDMEHNILSTINEIFKIGNDIEQQLVNLDTNVRKVQTDVKTFKNDLDTMLQAYEQNVLEKVQDLKETQILILNGYKKTCKRHEEDAKKLLEGVHSGSIGSSFVETKLRTIQESLSNLDLNQFSGFSFKPNPKIKEEIKSFKALGIIDANSMEGDTSYARQSLLESSGISRLSLKAVEPLCLEKAGHDIECISSVAVFDDGRILVVDKCKCILLFSEKLQLKDEYFFQQLHDIVICDASTFFATTPLKNAIHKCTVKDDKINCLKQLIKIKDFNCKSIDYNFGYLAVCSKSIIHIWKADDDFANNVKIELEHNSNICDIALDTRRKMLFLTDQSNSNPGIKCMTFDKKFLWSFCPPDRPYPSGLVLSKHGIFVLFWSTGEIINIDFEGKVKAKLKCTNQIKKPLKIAFNEQKMQLYISQHDKNLTPNENATIQIMKIEHEK